MRDARELTDIDLIFGNKRIPCHKIHLATSSAYFRTMFLTDLKESKAAEIEIHDVDEVTGTAVIDYLYRGELKITEDNAEKLLAASDMFLLKSAKDLIENFLCAKLHPDNCWGMLNLAKLYQLDKLRSTAFDHLIANLPAFMNSNGIKELNDEDMADLLTNKAVNWPDEEAKFEALQKWAKTNDAKKANFPILLALVNLQSVSKDFLCKVVAAEELMHTTDCMKHFQEALTAVVLLEESNPAESLCIFTIFGSFLKLVRQNWEKVAALPVECQWSVPCVTPQGLLSVVAPWMYLGIHRVWYCCLIRKPKNGNISLP
jgi:hypothetical protein